MAPGAYCAERLDQGLTCLRENLVLLRRLSEDEGSSYTHVVRLYQCKVCQGLYKYIYATSYQPRNLDADAGWTVYSDAYFKVAERNAAGVVQFPLAEARIYGYPKEEELK
jgi:hypothetical protein